MEENSDPAELARLRKALLDYCRQDTLSIETAFHAERRVGDCLPLANGTAARRLQPVPFPEHEPASPALGRNLRQAESFCVKAFPKVFQVIFDLPFGYSDGKGDFFRAMRTFLQEGADLASYRILLLGGR